MVGGDEKAGKIEEGKIEREIRERKNRRKGERRRRKRREWKSGKGEGEQKQIKITKTLLEIIHNITFVSCPITVFGRLTFVIEFFARSETDFQFGSTPIIKKQANRYQG